MSFRYSSCLSFNSPNMRSDRTSEKPMMAFSGVRSSWDMFARNSDLCWLATLFVELSQKADVFDGNHGLIRKGREHLYLGSGERSDLAAPSGKHANRCIFLQQWNKHTGPGAQELDG